VPYALLFPGQASQQVGMGTDFWCLTPDARSVVETADRVTGLPISEVIAHGPLERLTDTRYAQPAVVATSLVALVALRKRLDHNGLPGPGRCAGHSVGEFAALVGAGALSVEAALRLVARRSQLMAEACDRVNGAMAAVFGLDEPSLIKLCRRASQATDQIVDIANLNAPDQLVISGHRKAIEWLQREAASLGARRVMPLNVGGPFHSAYMRPAAEAFAVEVSHAPLEAPNIPVVLNQTGRATRDREEIRCELARQVAAPVRWSESLLAMAQAGCTLFVEVGPGQVLSGLVRRTLPGARAFSVSDKRSLEQAVAAVNDVSDGATERRRDGESG
jgi:[acyl-carrier-protein] S-malonyltransferase